MTQAKLKFDAPLTARRALRAPRKDVALALSWDHKVVQKLTDRIAVAAYRAPRNATVRITLRHMIKRASHSGRSLDAKALRGTVEAAIANPDPASSRVIKPKRRVVKAKVTTRNLARSYPAVVTIDRAHFKLRLFKRLKFVKSYGVAVGAARLPDPDRPLLDHEQAGQPGVDGAELAVGRRARRAPRRPAAAPPTR